MKNRHALVGPVKLWEMKRDFQIQWLKASGLSSEDRLLDIGCGTLRGGLPLIDYLNVGNYFGIEVRQEVLEEGKKELQEAGLVEKNPSLFLSADSLMKTTARQFDFIWAFSTLIHMDDATLSQTLTFANQCLAKHGKFYANVNVGDNNNKGDWQGFPVVWRSLEFYRDQCAKARLVVEDLGVLRDLGHVSNVEAQDRQRMLCFRHG